MSDISPPKNLTLAYNTSEWPGTFQTVLRALIEDLLSDGTGFGATIRWVDASERYHEQQVFIRHYEHPRIIFAPGIALDTDLIYYIEV